jgi:hypothetical protein
MNELINVVTYHVRAQLDFVTSRDERAARTYVRIQYDQLVNYRRLVERWRTLISSPLDRSKLKAPLLRLRSTVRLTPPAGARGSSLVLSPCTGVQYVRACFLGLSSVRVTATSMHAFNLSNHGAE